MEGLEAIDPRTEEEFERFWDELAREVEEASDAVPRGEEEDDAPALTFDERVERLMRVVDNKASHKELLRKMLVHCQQQRALAEVEQTVQGYPEFRAAGQNPYRLIVYLVEGGGLEKLELDEEGNRVTDDCKAGLTEDEVDDLVVSYALKTTDVGRVVADRLAPKKRIKNLLSLLPERFDAYIDLLKFCQEPRSMTAIDKLLSSRDLSAMKSLNPGTSVAIKPSVFVDKMERAGGIVWKDGWTLTEEGKAFLESVLQERA